MDREENRRGKVPFFASIQVKYALSYMSVLLIVVVLAPFVEEVLFRGLVFGNLKLKSRPVAYVVSCALFAALQVWQFAVVRQDMTYFIVMLQYLVPGFMLAWVYDRSGTLWTAIGLHAAANALAAWTYFV